MTMVYTSGQTANDCRERKRQPLPEMRLLVGRSVNTKWSALGHIYTDNKNKLQ